MAAMLWFFFRPGLGDQFQEATGPKLGCIATINWICGSRDLFCSV